MRLRAADCAFCVLGEIVFMNQAQSEKQRHGSATLFCILKLFRYIVFNNKFLIFNKINSIQYLFELGVLRPSLHFSFFFPPLLCTRFWETRITIHTVWYCSHTVLHCSCIVHVLFGYVFFLIKNESYGTIHIFKY